MSLSIMDPSSKTKISNSRTPFTHLLLYQYSDTVVNFNNISIQSPPPISNGKDLNSAIHKSISLTLAILTMFLQIKYQDPGLENPFKTHPNTMAVALWATLVYFVACSDQICSPADGRRSGSRHCVVWSGNVVVASLASLFAPDLVWPVLYGAAVLLLIWKRVVPPPLAGKGEGQKCDFTLEICSNQMLAKTAKQVTILVCNV